MNWEYAQVRQIVEGVTCDVQICLPGDRWQDDGHSVLYSLNKLGRQKWELMTVVIDPYFKCPLYTLKRPTS
jgi:hypothetical protein